MHLDNNQPLDPGAFGRDQRVRPTTNAQGTSSQAPAAPVERPKEGGPEAGKRPEQDALQREADDLQYRQRQAGRVGTQERRQQAERELARLMRLPADTRVQIDVDVARDEVRFQIRDRHTGELLREVPPDEARPLLEQLEERSGSLVDRSL